MGAAFGVEEFVGEAEAVFEAGGGNVDYFDAGGLEEVDGVGEHAADGREGGGDAVGLDYADEEILLVLPLYIDAPPLPRDNRRFHLPRLGRFDYLHEQVDIRQRIRNRPHYRLHSHFPRGFKLRSCLSLPRYAS